MARSDGDEYHIFFHASLSGGVGDSCALDKVQTLVNHPEYNWGGSIPLTVMSPYEVKWYGSIRLLNCSDFEVIDGWRGQMIIAFSDRKEWQDVLYCAAVIHVLSDLKMKFNLPSDIMDDPVWGSAINIIEAIL